MRQHCFVSGEGCQVFTQANDSALVSRVKVQLEMAVLLNKLHSEGGCEMPLSQSEEQEAAQLVLKGVKCGMSLEVRELCELLLERVGAKELFRYEVMNALVRF